MVIKTLDKTYTVIRELLGQFSIDRYVCREDETEELATLVCIRDKDVIRQTVDFLMQQQKNHKFADLKECFFFEGSLYSAFAFKEGRAVSDVLMDSECSLEQRLKMTRSVLEKLMLLAMPDYFMWDALDRTHVFFTDGLEVFFQFGFWKIQEYGRFDFKMVQSHFAVLFELIFSEELVRQSIPLLADFLQDTRQAVFADLPELFTAYDRMEKDVLAEPEEERMMPKTWPFRLWDRIKGYIPTVKKAAMAVLLLAAVLFLIWSFRESMNQGGQKVQFEQIGTVDIKDE